MHSYSESNAFAKQVFFICPCLARTCCVLCILMKSSSFWCQLCLGRRQWYPKLTSQKQAKKTSQKHHELNDKAHEIIMVSHDGVSELFPISHLQLLSEIHYASLFRFWVFFSVSGISSMLNWFTFLICRVTPFDWHLCCGHHFTTMSTNFP